MRSSNPTIQTPPMCSSEKEYMYTTPQFSEELLYYSATVPLRLCAPFTRSKCIGPVPAVMHYWLNK